MDTIQIILISILGTVNILSLHYLKKYLEHKLDSQQNMQLHQLSQKIEELKSHLNLITGTHLHLNQTQIDETITSLKSIQEEISHILVTIMEIHNSGDEINSTEVSIENLNTLTVKYIKQIHSLSVAWGKSLHVLQDLDPLMEECLNEIHAAYQDGVYYVYYKLQQVYPGFTAQIPTDYTPASNYLEKANETVKEFTKQAMKQIMPTRESAKDS